VLGEERDTNCIYTSYKRYVQRDRDETQETRSYYRVCYFVDDIILINEITDEVNNLQV